MNKLDTGERIVQKIALIILVMLSTLSVAYAAITFSPNINGQTLNLTEDIAFFYDVNTSNNESFVTFSSNAGDTNLTSFSIDTGNGTISFTPTNAEVGVHAIQIIAENSSNAADNVLMTVFFNVSNANDPPSITGVSPAELNTSVDENDTLPFEFNASDIDPNEVLNTSWFVDNVLVSENDTFNYTPDFCAAGVHNITLIVNDTAGANATTSWNITVNNTNRVPIQNESILNVSWTEGTSLQNNFTLLNFLSDEDNLECSLTNQDSVVYNVTGQNQINITINQTTGNVTFSAPQNFFGIEYVFFTISDGTNLTQSNNVTLNITNVNDAPQFNVTNRSLFQNALFTYTVNATDPDNEIQSGTDNLSYYVNASFFTINETTGLINFTPTASDVGNHSINITVNDSSTITSHIITFNVSANAVPRIDTIPPQNATEGTLFRINITGFDTDNDALTFTTNVSSLTVEAINNTAANISFTPLESDVGNLTVEVTVTDARGSTNTTIFNLTVFNVNNPPSLNTISNQTIRTDTPFTLTIQANDIDNDNLTFAENTSFFSIAYVNISAGLISFTPTSAQAGNETINFTVSDAEYTAHQVVYFSINNNTAPSLTQIRNHTIEEDSNLVLNLSASDVDGDSLLFYTNNTLFSVTTLTSSTALINFTPQQAHIGIHVVNISVNDTPLTTSELVIINVTPFNDTPRFNPDVPSLNATIGQNFVYTVNGTDEENDTLFFFDNATFFNISNSTGIINFTPTSGLEGNYSINLSVSDGFNLNTTIINFTIFGFNSAPNITVFRPNITNVSVAEGGNQQFNISVNDAEGDALTFSWRLNGTELSAAQNFTYQPDYDDAGFYNLTVIVSDSVLQDSQTWNVTVNNTNRPPVFGVNNQSSFANFKAGTTERTNISNGNITLSFISGNYSPSGNFTSNRIDFVAASNLSHTSISWAENTPENTSITFFISTSRDNSSFTNFTGQGIANYTTSNGSTMNISDRFVQFKAVLTTNNTNTTPTIEHVVLNYEIADFVGYEDTVYLNYIDLDNFFSEPDSDTMTYNASDVANIEIDIDSQGRVSLTPESNFNGERNVIFTATDGTLNATSNNVTLTFLNVAEPNTGSSSSSSSSSSSGGGGGGGGSSRVVFVNKTVLVNQSRSIELVVPSNIERGVDQQIIVPVRVQNNENYVMTGITLEAFSNRSDITMEFTDSAITTLDPGNFTEVDLIIEEQNRSVSFAVTITGHVEDPQLNDTVIVSIQVNENVSEQISYVRDFVQLNPECLELTEIIEQAQQQVALANYDTARVLLNTALEECKYLLAARRLNVEQPTAISLLQSIRNHPYFIVAVLIIAAGIISTIGYMIYNRMKWY